MAVPCPTRVDPAVKLPILAAVAACTALGGCESVLRVNSEDAQKIVDGKAVGVPAGDFFQRYGKPAIRREASDGTVSFEWEGGTVSVAAGVRGLEDKICRLHITTDKRGRIVTAPIIRDAKGERRLSRCAELFDTAG